MLSHLKQESRLFTGVLSLRTFHPSTNARDKTLNTLLGHSITYRIAVGPQAGRKVITLQTPPAGDEPLDADVAR